MSSDEDVDMIFSEARDDRSSRQQRLDSRDSMDPNGTNSRQEYRGDSRGGQNKSSLDGRPVSRSDGNSYGRGGRPTSSRQGRQDDDINLPSSRSENSNSNNAVQGSPTKVKETIIVFNASKREKYHPSSGFKKLHRRLRGSYKVRVNKDDLSQGDVLREASLLVMGSPREKFSTAEFQALKEFVNGGGSVLYMASEGGEVSPAAKGEEGSKQAGTNFNYLLEEYGMSVNPDCVVRAVYHKYTHPKEALVTNGVLSRTLAARVEAIRSAKRNKMANKEASPGGGRMNQHDNENRSGDRKQTDGLRFVYPRGCTLNVVSPATALLSSGYISYPLNRPVLAVAKKKVKGSGKIAVIGSSSIFADDWLLKEENSKLQEALFGWLLNTDGGVDDEAAEEANDLSKTTADDADFNEKYEYLPDTEALSERLRSCLQESEEVNRDFTKLFDDQLFSFNTDLIKPSIDMYKELRIKHEPLSLIPPQFETPLPPLQVR
jgi:intraflagellar transport protein 52|tara:strand:- start:32 stop:1498 length:1467 start_codon:yes stop_codon:yes gene_type:complete